jgi:acyl carrier protein
MSMTLNIVISLLSEITGVSENDFNVNTPLTPEFDIESIDIAKLIIEIENRFDITIHDEYVHTFLKLRDVAEYVDALIDE